MFHQISATIYLIERRIKMPTKKSRPIADEELRLLYPAVLNDIQFIKKQQVDITNYVVGGLVAIVLFFNMVVEKAEFIPCLRLILCSILGFVSLIILILGILYILKLEDDLKKSWERKRRTILCFTDGFRDILGVPDITSENSEKEPSSTVIFFITAISLAEILVFIFLMVR
jgi:hypothetical protein